MNKVLILIVLVSSYIFPKLNNNLHVVSLLDSVKTFYGDTCNVGIKSNLISRLYKYQGLKIVKDYLKQYERIRREITDFRKSYFNLITKESGMILDLARVFKQPKQRNIANVCGIYLGPDNVTSLALSYIIIRSSVNNYFVSIIQLLNFDSTFKNELIQYGKDWFYSEKLPEIKGTPF